MNVQDLLISKKAKEHLISVGISTTEACVKEGQHCLAKIRHIGPKTLEVILAQCVREGLSETYEAFGHKEVDGAQDKIRELIKSADSVPKLFQVNPQEIVNGITKLEYDRYLVSRLGGKVSYNKLARKYCTKAKKLIASSSSFEEVWKVWQLCQRRSHEKGMPCFLNGEMAKFAADSATNVADFAQAKIIWNKVRRTDTGMKALKRMSQVARTKEELWQTAMVAKTSGSSQIWNKSIKALAKKL